MAKLDDDTVREVLSVIDWHERRTVVCQLPPSWCIAVVRLWCAGLLTASRTGQPPAPCWFCKRPGLDHWRHLVRCCALREVLTASTGRDFGSLSIVALLGLQATTFVDFMCPVLVVFTYQKVKHLGDARAASDAAFGLCLHPLPASQRRVLRPPPAARRPAAAS